MIKYYAACDDCTMSHYTPGTRARLIMVFDDETKRNLWAREHVSKLKHVVLHYHRTWPDSETPKE